MLQTIQSIKDPDSKPDNKESIWSTFGYYADNIIIGVTKENRYFYSIHALRRRLYRRIHGETLLDR